MEDFLAKVAEMRRLQKDYFKHRDPYALRAAKKAESEVDAYLSNGRIPASTSSATVDALQPSLF